MQFLKNEIVWVVLGTPGGLGPHFVHPCHEHRALQSPPPSQPRPPGVRETADTHSNTHIHTVTHIELFSSSALLCLY